MSFFLLKKQIQKYFFSSNFFANWISTTFSNFIMNLLNFFTVIKIARVLNPEGFGKYALITNTVALFLIISVFGTRELIIREISRDYSKTYFFLKHLALTRFFLFLISVILMTSYYIFSNEKSYSIILISIIILFGNSSYNFGESFSFGRQEMIYSAIINVLGTIFWFLIIFLLPLKLFTVFNICMLYGVTLVLKASAIFVLEWKRGYFLKENEEKSVKIRSILMDSFPFFWITFIASVAIVGPTIFLGMNNGNHEIGLFNASNKIINPFLMVGGAALGSLYPKLSSLFNANNDKYSYYVSISFKIIFFVGIFLAFFFTLFASDLIVFLYGNTYSKAIFPFIYQIWNLPLALLFGLIGIILASSNRQKTTAILATIASVMFSIFLYLASYKGALEVSIVLLSVSVFNMFYHYYFIRKYLIKYLSDFYAVLFFFLFVISFYLASYVFINFNITIRVLLFITMTFILYFFPGFPKLEVSRIVKVVYYKIRTNLQRNS